MIEALAQTAAILSFMTMNVKPDENSVVYFVGIDNARFKRPVEPGDQLKMDIEILRTSRGIWKYKATASVDGKVTVEAELMCTIRANESAQPRAGE
jgi:3-hydroxyacyl-[acyl-carrier-protein] dehydratase